MLSALNAFGGVRPALVAVMRLGARRTKAATVEMHRRMSGRGNVSSGGDDAPRTDAASDVRRRTHTSEKAAANASMFM